MARRGTRHADVRTLEDLARVARTLAEHFKTDVVYVVGSNAVLLTDPDAPVATRGSPDIDAFPANNREWEQRERSTEASEEINALFGWESEFHATFGFYIDGVDEGTSKFPPDWERRAKRHSFERGATRVTVVAPAMDDLIVAKLHRLEPKDRDYIEAWHRAHPLDFSRIKALMASSQAKPELETRAFAFLDQLAAAR